MKQLWQIVGSGIMTISVVVALTVGAYGDIGVGSSFSWGPGGTGTMQIRGRVLCAGCSLEEARQANPGEPALYQLTHRQGQLVMTVTWVSTPSRWSRVVWPARLWVRGEENLLRQLNAEANLFKDLEISGILSNTRTLDIAAVTIRG